MSKYTNEELEKNLVGCIPEDASLEKIAMLIRQEKRKKAYIKLARMCIDSYESCEDTFNKTDISVLQTITNEYKESLLAQETLNKYDKKRNLD